MSNQQLIEDLKATKTTLGSRGRCRTNLVRVDSTVCLDGAIGVAVLGNEFENVVRRKFGKASEPYRMLQDSPRAMAVIKAIYEQVKDVPLSRFDQSPISGITVKDRVASHRKTYGKTIDESIIDGVWIYNDWCDQSDQDIFETLDKVLAQEGGLA